VSKVSREAVLNIERDNVKGEKVKVEINDSERVIEKLKIEK
jgi:hypothetical protein